MNLYYIKCSMVTSNKIIEIKHELNRKIIFVLTVLTVF